jgi:hypothetical protein
MVHKGYLPRMTDLIGVVVGSGHFDCCRQVEDDRMLLGSVQALEPNVLNLVANLDGKLWLGLSESFGRVLELPVCDVSSSFGLVHQLSNQFDVLESQVNGLSFVVVEDGFAE